MDLLVTTQITITSSSKRIYRSIMDRSVTLNAEQHSDYDRESCATFADSNSTTLSLDVQHTLSFSRQMLARYKTNLGKLGGISRNSSTYQTKASFMIFQFLSEYCST